jgi:hypothetical protein
MVLIPPSRQLQRTAAVEAVRDLPTALDALAALVAARATTVVLQPVGARHHLVKEMLVAVMAAVARVAAAVVRVMSVLMGISMVGRTERAAMAALEHPPALMVRLILAAAAAVEAGRVQAMAAVRMVEEMAAVLLGRPHWTAQLTLAAVEVAAATPQMVEVEPAVRVSSLYVISTQQEEARNGTLC